MTTELTAIRKKLEKKLKEERYIHTLGVMYTAASMACLLYTSRCV